MILRREDSVTGTFDVNRFSLLPAGRQCERVRRWRWCRRYRNLCRRYCLAIMLKDDGLCFRSKHSWDVAGNLLISDLSLLPFQLDDIAVEFSLVLRAFRIVLAGWFCFDSARDGIACGDIICEIDFDLALGSIERGYVKSVGTVG